MPCCARTDQTHGYLSNGDDVYGLRNRATGLVSDAVGFMEEQPPVGWDVAGTAHGTKDHTLVRKSTVTGGNGGDWAASAGTSADDCEWVVLSQDDWTNLGARALV